MRLENSFLKTLCFGLRLSMAMLLLTVGAMPARADQSIIVRSGNGPIGTQDAQVHVHAYGRYGDITPTAADFEAAQTGTSAYIDAPYPTYLQILSSDPYARWIDSAPNLGGGSALYAIRFTVTDSVIGSATLALGYAVDNAINGIYLNGTPISGTAHDGDYHAEYYELRSDIGPLLKPNADNWLYVNASDYGAYAGILFNANITVLGGTAAAPSISPDQGGNTGPVTVRIIGSGFQPAQPDSAGSQIKLTGIGAEIDATNVTVVSPNIISGTFNLKGTTPGVRTVTVTNPTGANVVLTNGFTVLTGGCSGTTLQTLSTPPVKGRPMIFYLTSQNHCTVDSGPITIVAPLEPWSIYNPPPGNDPADPLPQQTDPFSVPNPSDPTYPGQLTWTLPSLPPGGSSTIEIPVTEDPTYPTGQPVEATGCTVTQLNNLANTCEQQLEIGLKLANVCKDVAVRWGDEACDLAIAEDYAEYGICMAGGKAICSFFPSLVRGSLDPNDLTGPQGGGTQGWFQDKEPLQYTLSYNNLATATNPATDVYLTDTFDPATMDLGSLTVGAISIAGGQYLPPSIPLAGNPFTHDIDLRPSGVQLLVRVSANLDVATNQVNVALHTLDPNTGLTPTDPTIGFLQPGAGGSVLFSLNSKPELSTGTAVKDNASVVFDSNPAIKAPQWLNTVDIIAPVSHVTALPKTETSSTFAVSWTGTDVGSGIEYYSIYVSDNGAPFTAWLSGTTATSQTFTGAIGHTYAFYSIGEDFAGNQESTKTGGDTVTEVVAKSSTTITLSATPLAATYGQTVTVKISLSGNPAPSGSLTYILDGGKANPLALSTGGASLSLGVLPAGTHTLAVSYAGDANYAPSSQTLQVAIAEAVLTATATNMSRAYGAANPVLTYTVTGFVNGDTTTMVSGTAALTTAATNSSPAGSYPITFATEGLGAANYRFTYKPGTLTVLPSAAPAEPTFSLKAGTYSTPQTLLITENTAGAVVYYTLDGTAPSASSTPYAGALAITRSETVSAVAIVNGVASPVMAAVYVISATPQCTVIDYSNGFDATSLDLNGSAKIVHGALQLTDGGKDEAGSAYFAAKAPVSSFVTDVTFQLVDPTADGITFVIQATGPKALGQAGGGLGYAGIGRSAALKFDLFQNANEGSNSTGTYLDGAYPDSPSIDLNGTGLDLHSGHVFHLHVAYDEAKTNLTLTDTKTGAVASTNIPGNLPDTLGANMAYVGFTGATGGGTATQNILSWKFSGGTGCGVSQ